MQTPLRLAILGCGRAANELHLPAMRGVADIEVVALSDQDDERMRNAARQAPRARCVRELSGILSDPAVDAVAVCTPPTHHAGHAIAVLDAGKHLFVEKPLALVEGDCDAVLAHAARTGTQKVVGFNLRQHRLLRAARAVITRGALGRIELVRSIFTTDIRLTRQLPAWRNTRATGGGVLFELATHVFDLWRWLLVDEVTQISALSRTGGDSDDAAAAVTAQLRSGAIACVQMSERTTAMHRIEVFGERGRMGVSLYDFDGLEVVPLTTLPGSIRGRIDAVLRSVRSLPAGVRGLTSGGDYVSTYARQWHAFAATLLRGQPAAATLEDGRAAARIAIAAAESAASGQVIDLKT
ncbi:MAG: Gfo/Idh/MocA family protein [Gemmatimonadaceae bacterium]